MCWCKRRGAAIECACDRRAQRAASAPGTRQRRSKGRQTALREGERVKGREGTLRCTLHVYCGGRLRERARARRRAALAIGEKT